MWMLNRFKESTLNKCPHQRLPMMDCPPIRMHIDENAIPQAVHQAAAVPLHWRDEVEAQLKEDEALGVISKVPVGTPTTWCHRMHVVPKLDGTPRRTVDLRSLNKNCIRESHHNARPYQQARVVPPNTWKTVTDAWNGYHSVPLHEDDRHLTTFAT